MISNELLDEIIYISLKKEFISKELIERIVFEVLNNCDEITQNHFAGLYFEKLDWDYALAGCYSDGRIVADYLGLLEEFAKEEYTYLQKNIDIIQYLIHEIWHLKEINKKLSHTFEGKLLMHSGVNFVANVYFNRAFFKTKDVEFANTFAAENCKKFYEDNYILIPTERIAEIGSKKDILDSLNLYPDFKLKYFDEYKEVNNSYVSKLKEGYRVLKNGKLSIPIIEYFTKLGRLRDLKKLGFDLKDKKLPKETRSFDTVTKMIYGFPIESKDIIEVDKMKIMTR